MNPSDTPSFRRAARIAAINVSPILQLGAEAARRKREGHDVIVLGAGEPDFDTPDNIKAAAIRAIEAGQTKYTLLDGTLELKEAIRAKFLRENGLDYALDEVTASAGAKQVIHNALMATVDAGDEVIVATPYWASYADMISIAGGTTVEVACSESQGFRLDPQALEAAITPRTRWLMLNSPSNPAGSAYAKADLRALADVLLRHPHVWVMSDDIYEHLIYDGFEFCTIAQVEPRLKSRTLTINGLSKAYAMTGWRLGYAGGPKAFIAAMAVVQSQSTSNPCSVTQAAAIEALNGPQEILAERRASFQARRDLVVDALNAMDGICCRRPEGALYTYANCVGVLGRTTPEGERLETDGDFCRYLLNSANVAVVPGSCFGLAPYFRISYATSAKQLEVAMQRIAAAIQQLR